MTITVQESDQQVAGFMDRQFAVLVAKNACTNGGQYALKFFWSSPLRHSKNSTEIVDNYPGQHHAVVVSLHLFRRRSWRFIQEIVLHQVLYTCLHRPAYMIIVEYSCRAVVSMGTAKTPGFVGFFVLLDDKPKKLSGFSKDEIPAGNAIVFPIVIPCSFADSFLFPSLDLGILLQAHSDIWNRFLELGQLPACVDFLHIMPGAFQFKLFDHLGGGQ